MGPRSTHCTDINNADDIDIDTDDINDTDICTDDNDNTDSDSNNENYTVSNNGAKSEIIFYSNLSSLSLSLSFRK